MISNPAYFELILLRKGDTASACPVPVAKTSFLLRYRACTTTSHGRAMYPSNIYSKLLRVVHGGGGRIRTAVPRHQGKSRYMFILIFGFPVRASTGEIP